MIVVTITASTEWEAVCEIEAVQEVNYSPLGCWFSKEIRVNTDTVGVAFFHGGEGKIPAACSTQYIIDTWRPKLLVNLGTCGGFKGRIEKGTIILVERTVVYDIYDQMVNSDSVKQDCSTDLDITWLRDPYPQEVRKSMMLSADRDIVPADIAKLEKEYNAVTADWESGSIAYVANKNKTRCLILRGVSDLVNSGGGEAYAESGDINVFRDEARLIMTSLLRALPSWLALAL